MSRDHVVDEDLAPGARNAIRNCLRLQAGERLTLITDRETADIAQALVNEIESVGSEYAVFVLEDYAVRPLAEMPSPILKDLAQSQVSLFVAQAQEGELMARMAMTNTVNSHRIRHGHMVNIDRRIMTEGMRADFLQVDALGSWVMSYVEPAKTIRITSPAGTDVTATFSPNLRWLKTSGIISPQKWGNLPGGEVFTAPDTVNGRFVVDGVVGDYLCRRYGDLRANPLVIDIEDTRVAGLECDNADLLAEFGKYILTDSNSDRVGEFAIGTNLAVTDICGNLLQDEKMPGIHIAFGNPYPEHTGQTWSSSTHVDCVGRDFTIVVDGEPIMVDGRFLWSGLPPR